MNPILISSYRNDGRLSTENREISIKLNSVKSSTGSCLYKLGQTKVIAWINGPNESKHITNEKNGNLKCIFTIAPFSTLIRKKDFKRDLKMKNFSKDLKDIFEQIVKLELYVKSEIIINVLLLQNDGNYKSASINAVSMALINAGIFIKDIAIGNNVGINDINNDDINIGSTENDNFLFDLSLNEEKQNLPICNVAYLPHSKKFIYNEILNAKIKYKNVESVLKAAEDACVKIYEVEEEILRGFLMNKL